MSIQCELLPSSQSAERHGIYAAKGMTSINEFICHLVLSNIGPQPMKLPEGTIVGNAEEVNPSEYLDTDTGNVRQQCYQALY